MGLGVSIFLIAVGAILAWAVSVDTNGIDLNMVGVILMIVAAFGFIPAAVGAAIQELVDLAAILNALRAIGPRGTNDPGTGRHSANTDSYERFHSNE